MQRQRGPATRARGDEPTEHRTYAETLRSVAALTPDSVILQCGVDTRTAGQLWDRSLRVAHGLIDAGVAAQDRVAYLGRNSLEYFEILYGASVIGAVSTSLNWRLSSRELAAVLNDTGASVLFVDRAFLDRVASESLALSPLTTIVVSACDAGSQHRSHLPRCEDYDTWLARQTTAVVTQPIDPDAIAIQTYTSGTTSTPKGVTHSVRAIAATFTTADLLEISGGTKTLIATPVFHATASGAAANVVAAGGRCVIARDGEPSELLRLLEHHHINHAVLVPTLIRNLLDSPRFPDTDLSALSTVVYAGSPISPALLEQVRTSLPHVRLIQVYGSTETIGVTLLSPEEHEHHSHTAGRPMPEVAVRLVDPVTGAEVTDRRGELWVRSPTVMAGYWNRPEATRHAITPDGFVRTGDIAELHDGFLVLVDRLDDMIISGGENVYPTEVESALAQHPGVAEVAVFGTPSERWGETVTAVVVRADPSETEVSAQDLIDFARSRLATYKCPTSVRFADHLPRNASGKILRRVLRRSESSGEPGHVNVQPNSEGDDAKPPAPRP